MDYNIDFNLVRSQKLLLIPQLKQALEILEMNSQELLNYIENQLEANPALEEATASGLSEGLDDRNVFETPEDDTDLQINEEPRATLSLKEHLLIQLTGSGMDKFDLKVGEYLIDNTDDNGYLKVDTGEVAAFFNIPDSRVLSILGNLQTLDPPGICARNLRECLLLQLKQLEDADEEAMLVVDRCMDELASNDAESAALSTGIPIEKVLEIFRTVRSLEPRPGREFYDNSAEKPVPADIIVQQTSDGFCVLYNDEAFPDICLSGSYASNSTVFSDIEAAEYVHDRVKSAVWLIKCLEQREDIIFTVAQELCHREQDFLKMGSKYLKLIDRSSFAASLELHESILEKVLAGKYLQCRWGTFEFGSFFDEACEPTLS
ncbi:MAG: hypothetical protein ABFD25_14195 [Clostridiaceae bacterium]